MAPRWRAGCVAGWPDMHGQLPPPLPRLAGTPPRCPLLHQHPAPPAAAPPLPPDGNPQLPWAQRETFDVLHYGAKGDGVTDDTQAIRVRPCCAGLPCACLRGAPATASLPGARPQPQHDLLFRDSRPFPSWRCRKRCGKRSCVRVAELSCSLPAPFFSTTPSPSPSPTSCCEARGSACSCSCGGRGRCAAGGVTA